MALAISSGRLVAVAPGRVIVQRAFQIASIRSGAAAALSPPARIRPCPRASPAGCSAGRASRKSPPRSGTCTSSFGSRVSSLERNKPYSLSRRPRSIARWRMTMLCSLLPVKYISANGILRVADHAQVGLDAAFEQHAGLGFAFGDARFRMPGWLVKNSMTSAGCFDEASKSMSPMISRCRRRLPAALQRITSGCERNASSSGSASGKRVAEQMLARRRRGGD